MNYFLYITMPTMRLVHATRSIFGFGIWGLKFFGIGILGTQFFGIGIYSFFSGTGILAFEFHGIGNFASEFSGMVG